MKQLEAALRAYIAKLEAEAGRTSTMKKQRKSYAIPCVVLFGVLLCVLLSKREGK